MFLILHFAIGLPGICTKEDKEDSQGLGMCNDFAPFGRKGSKDTEFGKMEMTWGPGISWYIMMIMALLLMGIAGLASTDVELAQPSAPAGFVRMDNPPKQ